MPDGGDGGDWRVFGRPIGRSDLVSVVTSGLEVLVKV